MECVSSVSYTLLVNGSLTSTFHPTQVLRQGDPLSPYFFLLCANILSISLLQAEYSNKIKGVKMGGSSISFTHLFFADDSLLFFKNDRNSLGNIQSILNWYYSISGQKINLAKFDIFCSPNIAKKCQVSIARSLNVNFVQHPSKYLSINFKLRRNGIADFNFPIDKLHSKLQDWKSRLLSQASRTTPISSLLHDYQKVTFFFFFFLALAQ